MTISSCVKKLDFEVNVTRAPESHCDPGALSFDNSEKHVDEVKFIPIKWDHHKRSEAGGHQQLNRKRLFRHSPQLLAPPYEIDCPEKRRKAICFACLLAAKVVGGCNTLCCKDSSYLDPV